MPTYTVEEYLEAIYHLQEKKELISTSKLAAKLNVSSPSASDMIKKLADRGFVKYKPYKGVALTKKGEKEAVDLVRRHRISERFLTDILGLDWDAVHDEACKFEHVLSKNVQERLEKVLGNPKTCPHGNPIPSADGEFENVSAEPLSAFEPGSKGQVVKVTNEDPDFLEYLRKLGLVPLAIVEVTEVAPFGGPLTIKTGDKKNAVARSAASQIWMVKNVSKTAGEK